MKIVNYILVLGCCLLFVNGFAQTRNEIDSLVAKMRTVHKEWNAYSEALIKIGEPAVPGLIENATDKNLKDWNRRISMVTLNTIHSEKWVKPALNILFDDNELPEHRNRVTAGLSGFDLSGVKNELWVLYESAENQFYKSNLAGLLLTADTAMAYKAFYELYSTEDGHIQRYALGNLVMLRPEESARWYLNALIGEDWMTANLAMDSLISSEIVKLHDLINCYENTDAQEEIQWRVIYILGQRGEAVTVPFLCKALKNEYWLVRTEAAVALSHFDADLVEKELKILKNDSEYFVRANTLWILQQMGKK